MTYSKLEALLTPLLRGVGGVFFQNAIIQYIQ
jgi:hypothetical protein